MSQSGQAWNAEELSSAVSAYLKMLDDELAGRLYSKAGVNRELREVALSTRTKASVEYRMQNISAALQDIGQPYIQGYKPAKNVGANVIAQIQQLLVDLRPALLEPTDNHEVFEKRVSAAIRTLKATNEQPIGQKKPKSGVSTSVVYARCPKVKAWVLNRAKGVCEGCGEDAPFSTDAGEPFLEVHHVKRLADGGEDTVNNAVALCPNCHRRSHYSSDREAFSESLLSCK